MEVISSSSKPSQMYLYKGKLIAYATTHGFDKPDYHFQTQGLPHEPCFRATVHVAGQTFTSPETFNRRKDAEHFVSKLALESLSNQTQPNVPSISFLQASVTGAKVKGLKGCKTLNKDPDPQNPLEGTEEREIVDFPGFVDCVYLYAPNKLIFENGLGDTITVENTNWTDAVLWNPHLQMEACYKDFVCVENAQIEDVQVTPERSWIAEQTIALS